MPTLPATTSASMAEGTRRTPVPRLPGVDAMRGLAAFGVVLIHASLVVGGDVMPAAGALQDLCSTWVVPFFLAAAFFFAMPSSSTTGRETPEDFGTWLRRRAGRLLIPFALWTMIYAGARTVKTFLRHDPERAWEPWRDPATLLLTGGGAVALYFLPLLFAGLLVGRALGPLPRRSPVGILLALAAGAIFAAEIFTRSGNGFALSTGRAFTPALGGNPLAESGPGRIVLVMVADAVRCLPFVLLAAFLARVLPSLATRWSAGTLRAAGVAVFAGTTLLPPVLGNHVPAWPETFPGFGMLFFAWTLSLAPWPEVASRWAGRLGAWSFGIFLAHQLVLEAMQLALGGRLPTPAGPGTLLAISLVAFAACAGAIRVAEATGWRWPRQLFALP